MIKIKDGLYINPEMIKRVYVKPKTDEVQTFWYVMIDDLKVDSFWLPINSQPYAEAIIRAKEIIELINKYKTSNVKMYKDSELNEIKEGFKTLINKINGNKEQSKEK